jgi:putative flippase GtrA
MRVSEPLAREIRLAAKFGLVSVIGFAVDAGVLHLGIDVGLGRPAARLISLAIALQITFALSRRLVFTTPGQGSLAGHWWRYMIANSFGGLCNFGVFVGLTALKWPLISGLWVALALSSGAAYVINYAGTRLFVFGRDLAGQRGPDAAAAAPEP